MSICERLFMLLEQSQDKSAADLCRVLGVNTSQTTNWKQRNTDPPAKYLMAICEYLGVSVEYLLTGQETSEDIARGLSDEERDLVELYRGLDKAGRRIVMGEAEKANVRLESEQGGKANVG